MEQEDRWGRHTWRRFDNCRRFRAHEQTLCLTGSWNEHKDSTLSMEWLMFTVHWGLDELFIAVHIDREGNVWVYHCIMTITATAGSGSGWTSPKSLPPHHSLKPVVSGVGGGRGWARHWWVENFYDTNISQRISSKNSSIIVQRNDEKKN